MGTSCSNSGYMGYPVAQLVLGSIAPVALALNMVFENLIKLPLRPQAVQQQAGWRMQPRQRAGQGPHHTRDDSCHWVHTARVTMTRAIAESVRRNLLL